MKRSASFTITLFFILSAFSADSPAHGGIRFYGGGWYQPGISFYWGLPYGYPSYYSGFYYPPYYPPVYRAPSTPPVYIEPGTRPQVNPQEWAYCPSADSYYPHVTVCPEGWQTIRPYPEGGSRGYWFYCDDPPGYYPYIRQCYRPWRQIRP
ncbi:MAG: hypothetical protein ACU83V_07845 [Gammaproteobacteria bacterium]